MVIAFKFHRDGDYGIEEFIIDPETIVFAKNLEHETVIGLVDGSDVIVMEEVHPAFDVSGKRFWTASKRKGQA